MLRKLILFGLLLTLLGCGANSETQEQGRLQIHANGEDFVRQGFTSIDGWNLSFEQVNITVSDIRAYQTDPPYEAAETPPTGVFVAVEDTLTLNLATSDPIIAADIEAPVGHYNAISWQIPQADAGSIVLVGSAEKDTQTIPFTLSFTEALTAYCGEYIGAERKGFVTTEGPGDLEMTFHFDHIFGDVESPTDEAPNSKALGFEPFVPFLTEGSVTQNELKAGLDSAEYTRLTQALKSLSHVGEGHCNEG